MSPQRVARIRNELRLWMRQKYGLSGAYAKSEIDFAREQLGFDSADDALVAYTFFGPDLVPGLLASTATSLPVDELADIIAALDSGAADAAGFFLDDGL